MFANEANETNETPQQIIKGSLKFFKGCWGGLVDVWVVVLYVGFTCVIAYVSFMSFFHLCHLLLLCHLCRLCRYMFVVYVVVCFLSRRLYVLLICLQTKERHNPPNNPSNIPPPKELSFCCFVVCVVVLWVYVVVGVCGWVVLLVCRCFVDYCVT